MAYEKHNFEDGQVLNASALNEMDNQIAANEAAAAQAGGVVSGSVSDNSLTLNNKDGSTAVIQLPQSGGDFSAKWIGKWKTGVQCVDLPLGFLILILGGAAAPCWVKALFVILLYVVVYLTLYSGWIYIRAAIGMGKKTNDIPSSEKKD